MTATETRLLILQGTPFCNIGCTYCYLPDRDLRRTMSMETLRRTLRLVEDAGLNQGNLTAAWHAGEPLVLPPEYYREAFQVVRDEQSTPISLSVQTNAITVSDAFCQLFCEYDVNIGVSLDGPATTHDRYRLTRNNRGTHALTVAGLKKLHAWGLEPRIIAVVTAATLERPAHEFLDFFRTVGANQLCLNFEEIEGVNVRSTLAGDALEAKLREFLTEMYSLTHADSGWWVREFASAETALMATREGCNYLTEPFKTMSVDWAGNVSTFCPELLGMRTPAGESFVFGNVDSDSLESFQTRRLLDVQGEIERGVAKCRSECEYFDVCLGGSPANKLSELGRFDSTETLACRLRVKAVVDTVATFHRAAANRSQSGA